MLRCSGSVVAEQTQIQSSHPSNSVLDSWYEVFVQICYMFVFFQKQAILVQPFSNCTAMKSNI